ncbi:unnamed protein product, partial [Choristocarpus tenellus]
MDTHEDRLFSLRKNRGGFFSRVSKLVYADKAAEERERVKLAALSQLMTLSWVPVLTPLPSKLLPKTDQYVVPQSLGSDRSGATVASPRVVAPGRVRPREDMWFSSKTFYVLDAEVRSSEVKSGFGWDQPLDPVVVARQITGMAKAFPQARNSPHMLSSGDASGEGEVQTGPRAVQGE